MRISDWSSDVCSSDLRCPAAPPAPRSSGSGWRGSSAGTGTSPGTPARWPLGLERWAIAPGGDGWQVKPESERHGGSGGGAGNALPVRVAGGRGCAELPTRGAELRCCTGRYYGSRPEAWIVVAEWFRKSRTRGAADD